MAIMFPGRSPRWLNPLVLLKRAMYRHRKHKGLSGVDWPRAVFYPPEGHRLARQADESISETFQGGRREVPR